MKKILLFILTTLVVCFLSSCEDKNESNNDNNMLDETYVDLGLPSHTLWKSQNEAPNPNDKYGFYTYDEAVSAFGYRLPTKEQCQELLDECTWSWTFGGYKITGNNGNYIILPPDGESDCEVDTLYGKGKVGSYWSAAPERDEYAWSLYYIKKDNEFHTEYKYLSLTDRCNRFSIRLVK